MRPFKHLSFHDNRALFNFPVYIVLLAANGDGQLDDVEKFAAIEFAHIKTFSCDQRLKNFYSQAESVFENNLKKLNKKLPVGKIDRERVIKKELLVLEKIILKLKGKDANLMHHYRVALTEHVSKAHHNILIDFIMPLPIIGLSQKSI